MTWGINQPTGGVTSTFLNSMLDQFAGFIPVDNNCTLGPAVARVGQDGGEPITVEGTATEVGQNNVTSPSPNVALLLRKRTARGGRRGRGRMFLPWAIAETSIDEAGNVDSGVVSAYTTGATSFLGWLDTNDAPMVILHSLGGSTAPGVPDTVTDFFCDNRVATQRRRLRR